MTRQITRQIKAVIFDFDGVIVDTETAAYQAWSEIYLEHGHRLALADWVNCVGSGYHRFDPVLQLSALTGRTLDRSGLINDKERRKRQFSALSPLMDGVADRITEARSLGLCLAIASSSHWAHVHSHSLRLGILDLFDVFKTAEDVTNIKPAPDLYLAAAEALGVEGQDCLVFEDSANGVLAAKAAGMFCLAVPNAVTRGLDFSMADGVIGSLLDINLSQVMGQFIQKS